MDFFSVALLIFAVIFLGGILVLMLVLLWSLRARERVRLEMKRHLQKMDAPPRAP